MSDYASLSKSMAKNKKYGAAKFKFFYSLLKNDINQC